MSKKAIKAVVNAYATDDHTDGPDYAVIRVTQILIDRIAEMVEACEKYALSEVRTLKTTSWGPGDVREELRLQNGELVVLPGGSFWFRDQPNSGYGHIETRASMLSDLKAVFESAEGGDLVFLGDDDGSVEERYREVNDIDSEDAQASPGEVPG